MTLPTEGQSGHLQKHADIDTLIAGHTTQIAAGDVTNPASAAGIALSATFAPLISDTTMVGQGLFAILDSFGTDVAAPNYPGQIATKMASTPFINSSVGGSYFQDAANRSVGTGGYTLNGLSADQIGLIGLGINQAFNAPDAATRSGERDALETLIWLMASSSRAANSAWALTGAWSDYTDARLSGGVAKLSSTAGNSASVTPTAGDYVALGYNYAPSLGPTMGTGNYAKNGTTVYPNQQTPELGNTLNGSTLTQRVVRLLGLSGSDAISVTVPSGVNYVTVNGLVKLSSTPPWIVIIKPTYPNFAGSNASIDLYRADIDSVVSSVSKAYAPLRGKIIVVDPVKSGWVPTTMCHTDGIHPNALGAQFLRDLVINSVGAAARWRRSALGAGLIS